MILSFSGNVLYLILQIFLALVMMMIVAGLLTSLVRPFSTPFGIFALGGLTISLSGGFTGVSLLVGFLSFVFLTLYALSVTRELNSHLNFFDRPARESQAILIIGLTAVMGLSFYFGYVEQIKNEGFKVPAAVTNMLTDALFQTTLKQAPNMNLTERGDLMAKLREGLTQEFVKPVEAKLQTYARLISIAVTVILFWSLLVIARLFSWLPVLLLRIIFLFSTRVGWTKAVTEMREVKRLTIE